MKTSKLLMGTLAGGIAFFLLGWLVYGMLMGGYMAENMNHCAMKPEAEWAWWALILSNFVSALLITLVLSWSNTSGFMGGAKIGGTLGLLIGLGFDLSFYSMSTMFLSFTVVIVDVLVYTVMTGIVGGVIGWVLAGKKTEA